ncbi:MAG: glycosyltransferase family 2 protein [Verrucomicrobiota bacterium]|nr:glycosyltransferase family 2 protein [Verrucomicrobiota bacterium]
MKFSIITPSFRSNQWLPLCIASVADQEVEHEHIVQDAGSDDGTLDWLLKDLRVKAFVEKDRGMYDAVNKGFAKATGDILAYLNCDEQYLPGALKEVEKFFTQHPEVEIAFGDALITEQDGSLRCFRKIQMPWKYHTWISDGLTVLTAATFLRRSVLEKYGLSFNPDYRAIGDLVWVFQALDNKVPMKRIRKYTSIFTETGGNLGNNDASRREQLMFRERAPFWAKVAAPFLVSAHRLRRVLEGAYWEESIRYQIYTQKSPYQRTEFIAEKPSSRWWRDGDQGQFRWR